MQSSGRGNWAAQTPRSVLLALRVALIALPLLAVFAPKEAHAYAWMIKRGYPSCPACHADPSGGELLTAYGRMISTLTLSTNWEGEGSASNQRGLTRKIALRAPETFAAGPKAAGPEDAEEEKAEGDSAEGDKPEGDGTEASESSEATESTEEPAASAEASGSSSSSGESTFPNFLFGAFDLPEWLLLGGSYRHLNILPIQIHHHREGAKVSIADG